MSQTSRTETENLKYRQTVHELQESQKTAKGAQTRVGNSNKTINRTETGDTTSNQTKNQTQTGDTTSTQTRNQTQTGDTADSNQSTGQTKGEENSQSDGSSRQESESTRALTSRSVGSVQKTDRVNIGCEVSFTVKLRGGLPMIQSKNC
jgi:hypothetical protein